MLPSLRKCSLLYVCLFLILITAVLSDCPFPKKRPKHLRFIYQSPNESNMTDAPDHYLLRFRCISGYTRIGPKAIICLNNNWSDVIPSCTRMQCQNPPNIENGVHKLRSSGSTPWIGSTATYSCKEGYELLNDTISTLRCELDTVTNIVRWSGETPTCINKESCSDPGVSPDGERTGDCCFRGDTVEFSCNDDFDLVGNQKIVCLSTGKWSSERPLCRPKGDHCELPPVIPHGTPLAVGEKAGDYFQNYEEVQIMCDLGYAYRGDSQFLYCEDGEWDVEFGKCEEIFCDFPEDLVNGTIKEVESTNITVFPFLFELTYVCDEGYRLIGGDSWRFCDKKGWSGKTPSCEEIRCPDPGVPDHGVRDGESFAVGAKVHFKCFSGYDLLGSFERYCMPNGQWTGELTRCDIESNYCPNPGTPINGVKNSTTYDMGDRVGFRCRAGHILIGSEVRECLPNRSWSGAEAKCLGPYDYDVSAKVRDTLKVSLSEKAEEQKKHLQKYRKALYGEDGFLLPQTRTIDLNHPGRLILYFAFDVSGSVGEHNFKKSIEFAKAIVKRVGISQSGARAGALTFSSKAEIQFLPLIFTTTEQVHQALDGLNYTGGGTSATSALTLIREELIPLTQEVLGKKGQKSIVFILTDGRANMGGNPKTEADELKNANVEIYCIGITGDVSQKSLHDIASDPKEEHVFILDNYATLSWLIQEITNGTIDYSQCGLGLENIGNQIHRGRVVGGKTAVEPWPWMAALYFVIDGTDDKAELLCGGSIIHESYILTAAHCMYDKQNRPRKPRDIIVKLGLTNVKNETFVQEPEVMRVIQHPNYKHHTRAHDYDMAILHLRHPIEFNAHVRPICLPALELPEDTTLYKPTEFALATGWGHQGIVLLHTDVQIKTTEDLKEIILPIQSRERCTQNLIENRMIPSVFTDRMFCAGDGQGGNDTCQGDSGGPLMQSRLNSEGYLFWTQVGIVSWGIGCGLQNTYGFYTHVQNLKLWIDETIQTAPKDLN